MADKPQETKPSYFFAPYFPTVSNPMISLGARPAIPPRARVVIDWSLLSDVPEDSWSPDDSFDDWVIPPKEDTSG